MLNDYQKQILALDRAIQGARQRIKDVNKEVTITYFHQNFPPVLTRITEIRRFPQQADKIYNLSWAGGGSSHNPDALRILSSVSSDGTILVWNVETPSTPLCKIYLPEWLMSCNFEKREGRLLTVGGLSGKVWIFGLQNKKKQLNMPEQPRAEFQAHSNYIPCLEYINTLELFTGSADSTAAIWNIESLRSPLRVLEGHSDEVMSVSVSRGNYSILATGSCDQTTKIWDIRDKNPLKRTFASPGAINCVKFIPNSEYSLVSGCSNGTTYLYDLRGLKELGQFRDIRQSPISALTSSLSGRLLFTGNEQGQLVTWDIYDERAPIQQLDAHNDKITSVEISPLGKNIASASTDCTISMWGKVPKLK